MMRLWFSVNEPEGWRSGGETWPGAVCRATHTRFGWSARRNPAELVGFANPELIFDTSAGTGRARTPGCNIVICNDELLPFRVVNLLGDSAAQIGNAAGA
ncbi:hypothetical protein [Rhodococcus sp. IEGM 1406]|uniref:hypothetical protein n=1 Tax=Rhodococcus sp. IEGM 1406 TaxID=3047083 RepID=UPI00106145DC|nr:hypothetical protein [Rhodococcus sp. IEGM 1406]MDI9904375.1 hypothetical protein [Rhodococcus sp. IEGM 1406]